MLFPDSFFFAERRLLNHKIETKYVKDLDHLIAECADKNKIFPRQTTPIYISRLAVGWKASKADL